MVLWGTVSALMALVKTPAQLIAVRFVLGVTEAGFSPAVLFIISNWYRRHEQSKRFMCFLSAGILSGAFGGIIAGAIVDSLDGVHGISGWQWSVFFFKKHSTLTHLHLEGYSSFKVSRPLGLPFPPHSCSSIGHPPLDNLVPVNVRLQLLASAQTACTSPAVARVRSLSRTEKHSSMPSRIGACGSSALGT